MGNDLLQFVVHHVMQRVKDFSAVGPIAQGLRELHDRLNAEGFGVLFQELFNDPAMNGYAFSALARFDGLEGFVRR